MLNVVAVPVAGAKVALFATRRRPFYAPRGQLAGSGRARPCCCAGFAFYFLTSFMNSSFIKYASADKAEVQLAEGRE